MQGTYTQYYARKSANYIPRYLTRYSLTVQNGIGAPYEEIANDFREYWQAAAYCTINIFLEYIPEWLDYSRGLKTLYKGRIYHIRSYEIHNPNFKE